MRSPPACALQYVSPSNMRFPPICGSFRYAVPSSMCPPSGMQSPPVCGRFQYAVPSGMRSPSICSSPRYAVPSGMRSPLVCSPLQYAVPSGMWPPPACALRYVTPSHMRSFPVLVWCGMSFWPFLLPKLILSFLWLH